MITVRVTRCSTVLAVHPFADTGQVMFLFPDRQAGLGLVNNVPACIKGFAAVGGGNANDHGTITQLKQTLTVYAQGMADTISLDCFIDDLLNSTLECKTNGCLPVDTQIYHKLQVNTKQAP